jgi:hypothetical protein
VKLTSPSRKLAAALLATAALAGCGSDDGGGDSGGGGESSADPQTILADAQEALGKVKSFHMEGTGTDKQDGEQKISGDFSLPGKVQIKVESKGTTEIILADKQVFIRGDKETWEAQGLPKEALDLVVDKWVKLPSNASAGIGEFEAYANPDTIGHCLLGKGLGTVVSAGTGEVDGKKVDILEDKGDKPGSSPGKLYVASDGEPLPLRAQQTGPEKPGGKPDPKCGETDSDPDNTTNSDLYISKYNEPVTIEAPADSVDLEQLQQQSSS